jgi:hypothetical protein
MFHKVKNVTPFPNYTVYVEFLNGEKRNYDINPLFNKWMPFNSLREINGLFQQVKVDTGGYGISWNDEIDLECNELYYNGVEAE